MFLCEKVCEEHYMGSITFKDTCYALSKNSSSMQNEVFSPNGVLFHRLCLQNPKIMAHYGAKKNPGGRKIMAYGAVNFGDGPH